MGKLKFSPMGKTLNPEIIDGKMNSFARLPYGLEIRMSQPLAEDGYGTVTVDGIPISKGKTFHMNMVMEMDILYIPVGEVAREYGKEYTVRLSGFRAADGRVYPDQCFKIKVTQRSRRDPAFDSNDNVALCAAKEGMVLLKNEEHVLPLKSDSVLNCFGRGIYMFRNATIGASAINPRWQPNFVESVKEHSSFILNEDLAKLYYHLQDTVPTQEQLRAAKEKSDTAVIIITRSSGEFMDNLPDKGGYYLTDSEEEMIKAVASEFTRTAAIINSGYPIDLRWTETYDIKSVLYTGYAGMLAGYALMEILDGRANPSGKLPDTWCLDYYDSPASQNFINFREGDAIPGEKDKGIQLYYEEDIYVGYRYFDSFGKKTAYSFGHGLSYTTFSVTAGSPQWDGERVTVRAEVTNTGEVNGREAVQLYIAAPEGRLEKPRRVLAAFEKTGELTPGQTQALTLSADSDTFASFDEDSGAFVLEQGCYGVYVGNSLANAVHIGEFNIENTKVLRKTDRVGLPVEDYPRLSRKSPNVDARSRLNDLADRIPVPANRPDYAPAPLPEYSGPRITYPMLKANSTLLENFVAQMTDGELCTMNVCGGANWYLPWQNGEAGKTRVLRKYKMPQMLVTDGNAGINVRKKNIGMPSSSCVAASFNKELAYQVGAAIAAESKLMGVYQNLGPGMNIHRNILGGRNPEYFSEDPYLAGAMAGMHAKGLEDNGVGCCYKHLFCNNADTSRKGSQSIVSERALREIYFRVFEEALKIQKPSTVMTSYNSLNGIYPAENADLLQRIVRGEWGIDGMIMTDWGSYDTIDPVEIVKAGNCWLTEGSGRHVKLLKQAVKDGRLSRAVLEHNVLAIIKTMLKRPSL